MDDRTDSRIPPALERVRRPDFDGGAFRRIPILPVVALMTLFLGILVGYGLSPQPAAEPAPTPVSTAEPTMAPTPEPKPSPTPTPAEASSSNLVTSTPAPPPASPLPTVEVTPPSGGITLSRAIAIVKTRYGVTDSQILVIFVTDDRGFSSDKPLNRWIWEVLVAAKVGACASVPASASVPPTDLCFGSYSVIRVDYYTGQILP